MRVGDGSVWVVVKEWFTLLAVMTHGVMLTVVTDAATDSTSSLVDSRVEVTPRSVTITFAA